jgi:hypothetical protein
MDFVEVCTSLKKNKNVLEKNEEGLLTEGFYFIIQVRSKNRDTYF